MGWTWASNPEARQGVGVVVALGSPVDSVVRTCLKYLGPALAQCLADHLRSSWNLNGRLGKMNKRRLCMSARNVSPDKSQLGS